MQVPLPITEEILRFLLRALGLSTLLPAAPLPPLLPRDRQGTEPRALGTSVCPQDRLGQPVLAVGKGGSPAKATLQPVGAFTSWAQGSKTALGALLGPLQEPSTVSGAQEGRSNSTFWVFLKGKAILEVWGFPSTRYNKFHKAQIPCPVQKLQAGREGSAPALEIRQGHMAELLHE